MAAWRSAISSTANAPLRLKLGALTAHHEILQGEIGRLSNRLGKVRIESDYGLPRIAAGLTGEGCELAERTMGGGALLVPLRPMGAGLWAWLGYREEWDLQTTKRAPSKPEFQFRTAGLTVHFGIIGDRQKPQLFRAEWAGWTSWPEGLGFQAGDAGHPHWQFDALESLGTEAEAEEADALLLVLRAELGPTEPRDFVPQGLKVEDVRSLVRRRQLSKIHFPSGAHWWKETPHSAHAHAPNKAEELRRWVSMSIAYISEELARLATH